MNDSRDSWIPSPSSWQGESFSAGSSEEHESSLSTPRRAVSGSPRHPLRDSSEDIIAQERSTPQFLKRRPAPGREFSPSGRASNHPLQPSMAEIREPPVVTHSTGDGTARVGTSGNLGAHLDGESMGVDGRANAHTYAPEPLASSSFSGAADVSWQSVEARPRILFDEPSPLEKAWAFTREHVLVILVLLVLAAGFAGSRLFASQATEIDLERPSFTPTPSPRATSSPLTLVVHVLGEVKKPGLVTLAPGSRVADAIEEAGGLLETADPAQLNFASVVADGDQILIGSTENPRGEVHSSANGTSTSGSGGGSESGGAVRSGKISLNRASIQELESVPGIGPVMAERIVQWRRDNGEFTSVQQLETVEGIGEKTLEKLRDYVDL